MAKKWLTLEQLNVALKEQLRRPKRLGELMLDLGFISPNQLLEALSAISGLPFVSLSHQILDLSIVNQIPFEIAERYQLILFQHDDKSAHLAMADPEDLVALDKARLFIRTQLIPYHATEDEISQALEAYYQKPAVDTQHSEVTRLVNDLILEAVRLKASDIHLSPTAHSIEVAYRQDGLLCPIHTLHKERWPAISVRLKIMGGLDIAESRRPQNGRFSLTLGGREIDFRLSCHPTIHGENLVLRILDKSQSLRPLDALGFEDSDIETMKRLVKCPEGMILLSGPTGSGKTTTLYALLSHMDTLTRNIMTLEEPVEYYLPNIHQTEIRENGPFRFAEGVRSLLRQDPDVIFISEIRDAETAQMALRAAMTGHLILGTIHARDSYTIPQRLLDFGISASLLSGNLVAGMTQRLVRRLCEDCRNLRIMMPFEKEQFGQSMAHIYQADVYQTKVYQAKGCPSCQQTGYQGREAIAEVVLFNEELSILVSEGGTQGILRKAGMGQGIPTLWDKAIEKVLAGKTTFAEIDRVIGGYH